MSSKSFLWIFIARDFYHKEFIYNFLNTIISPLSITVYTRVSTFSLSWLIMLYTKTWITWSKFKCNNSNLTTRHPFNRLRSSKQTFKPGCRVVRHLQSVTKALKSYLRISWPNQILLSPLLQLTLCCHPLLSLVASCLSTETGFDTSG